MVWSSIAVEQLRRKSGHHRFSGCRKLCRGVMAGRRNTVARRKLEPFAS